MRVLYSFWGFITPLEKNSIVDTPDGERGNRVDWVDELLKRGHTPIQLQKMRDDEQYAGVEYNDTEYPDGDILYVEWRWPTYKNSGSNPIRIKNRDHSSTSWAPQSTTRALQHRR